MTLKTVFDFGFNCFVLLGLPVCLFVYFLHTSRDGSWRLLMRLRETMRLRALRLENQDKAPVAILAGESRSSL